MRKIIFFVLVLTSFISQTNAQGFLDPVTWDVSLEKNSGDLYTITMEAVLEEKWHLYSQVEPEMGPDEIGPIATEFSYNTSETSFVLVGETIEPDVAPIYDPIFEMDIIFFDNYAVFTQQIKVINPDTLEIEVDIYYSVCDDKQCLPPESKIFKIGLNDKKAAAQVANITQEDLDKSAKLSIPLKGMEKYQTQDQEGKTFLTIFFLGFIGGLIALLTPCVFPMIPLTVSFFTKSAKNKKIGMRNAILYGFFIFGIYVLLSLPFHLLDSLDPEILNNISTNVALNVIFFIIFIAFAFSFFGYYEITLPQSWSNKMDDKANSIGGIIGIFFMALTLAIVSFSCTGPILGSLLGGSLSSDGGAMQLSMGMGGFGLALALPFALFALFPNWLNTLPKSGGWLNTVKVVLGFVELALAFKFLSNADLVEHWGLLKREIFIAIWVICALGLALYLFGFIRFPHDGPRKKKLPLGNVIVGVASISFFLYLLPGLTNTKYSNLKLLSGFPPPMFYSLYERDLGITGFKDFYDGLAEAKISGKPIMIDFTGWACVNCRKMEEQVWTRDDIYSVITDDYILVSLYVDDRKQLDSDNTFNFLKPTGGTKAIKTVGDKWATFQTVNFKNNSQPYYILIDTDFNLLNNPLGYTPDADAYLEWLQQGLNTFSENNKN
ncbi:thioredoxin family protein [Flavobacteriaceae bacterium]|nr:thioredoxin family protein [Flavobacteriaceae bacterium]